MGMFDTIEIENDIENGPKAGEYQTKNLDSALETYHIQGGRLIKRVYKYNPIEESKRKHKWHFMEAEFIGLMDIEYHGWIEIYGAYNTWKLKFTDGELKECKIMEQFNQPTVVEEEEEEEEEIREKQTLKDGEIAYWSGDGGEYVIDEEE
jgi:hypothetical protein